MLDILELIGDIIAPPHPSIIPLRKASPHEFIHHFSPERVAGTFALSSYQEPLIHAAITANKFHNYPKAALLLASLFDHWLTTLPTKQTYIVPIPLGPKRLQQRGYNQVERVVYASSYKDHVKTSFLTRVHDTAPQTSLDREARFANMQQAFAVTSDTVPPLTNCRLIICDDVITTGATLRAATTALEPHVPKSCELLTVALAH